MHTPLLALGAILLCSTAMAIDTAPETLPSGVIIEKLRTTDGTMPAESNTVKVHYRGGFTDGSEFDSSYKRGEPASIPLAAVIPCWKQGVARMKVGEKAKLTCPADTAYGSKGRDGIPPDSTLVFEIELLAIEK